MRRPNLNSCCHCGTLKTGTIVIGVLGIVLAVLWLIFIFVSNAKLKLVVLQDLDPLIVRIIIAINLAMTILISTLLIVGALKRRRFLMLPWIVLTILLVVGLIFSILYTSIVLYIDKHYWLPSLILILGLIAGCVTTYAWLVVISFYQVITEEKSRGPYHRPLYQTYK